MGKNQLTNLPIQLKKLKQLQDINFEYNHIKNIPEDLFKDMELLKKIDFTSNEIENIPTSFTNKKNLVFMDFA